MEKLYIDLDKNSYWIYIGEGLIKTLNQFLHGIDKGLLITDDNIFKLYGNKVSKALEENCEIVVLPPGESTKSLVNVEYLLNIMTEKGLSRNSRLIALGGGVIGDITGFTASIFMRGIDFIQIPTSLLAQVDSSVGGKTGVNMAQGKNLVGSFHQPKSVIIDIDVLKTLPHRELISGIGEVIKYGIIYDGQFLDYIYENLSGILSLNEIVITDVIKRCCEIKAEIVSKDEREIGMRKILNFGHTIGHGIEAVTNFEKYSHGEAVLIGMYYEALIAKHMKFIDENYFRYIERIINETGVQLKLGKISFSIEDLINAMKKDKKNNAGKISFILPTEKGKVKEVLLTPEETLNILVSFNL